MLTSRELTRLLLNDFGRCGGVLARAALKLLYVITPSNPQVPNSTPSPSSLHVCFGDTLCPAPQGKSL